MRENLIAPLEPGFYWYLSIDREPLVCEKRSGETFLRFTNGAHQSWLSKQDQVVGPLQAPAMIIPSEETRDGN